MYKLLPVYINKYILHTLTGALPVLHVFPHNCNEVVSEGDGRKFGRDVRSGI